MARKSIIQFRPYQLPGFEDRSSGTEIWFWSRQIGKSFTLGAWAVDRLLTRPGRLVTVLSNSRDNGQELNIKCGEICAKLDQAYDQEDLSPDTRYKNMQMDMRLPQQQERLGVVCRLPNFRRACLDMTGLGLGLCEYAQDEFGQYRVQGINFSRSVPMTQRIQAEGRKEERVRVTEALATRLLEVYEDRAIQHPIDSTLREDLRKPERITTPGGRVSIAATRNEAGHADHFWSFALAVEASATGASVITDASGIRTGHETTGRPRFKPRWLRRQEVAA